MGEALSVLAAAPAESSAQITAAERDELAELAEATGEGAEFVAQLSVGTQR